MNDQPLAPWRIVDELIEQPSWGGRYIIDIKGLSEDAAWTGKKVGQSYELSRNSQLVHPVTGQTHALLELIADNPLGWLGQGVLDTFGADLSLLIKLTQAKGNSFQVHLPEGKTLGHWKPKPEAWFYLAPGLFTFGLKQGANVESYAEALHAIQMEMERLSGEVKAGRVSISDARESAQKSIREQNPYAYVNVVDAETDDVIDLSSGGIHHSWEEDNARFPDGNLVYEVQVDVPDELCSMRGFDKGKLLDDGSLRASHVPDYLATLEHDQEHNELKHHIRKPQVISRSEGVTFESLFRTAYFNLDRLTFAARASAKLDVSQGFKHLFVHDGDVTIGDTVLTRGQSYFLPAMLGECMLESGSNGAVILETYLPV